MISLTSNICENRLRVMFLAVVKCAHLGYATIALIYHGSTAVSDDSYPNEIYNVRIHLIWLVFITNQCLIDTGYGW